MLASPNLRRPAARDERRPSRTTHRSSFVGREAELRRLRALAGPARVVTIVGPAGAGKSRLALELARAFAHPLEVSLRGARSEEALLAAIASSLGIRLGRGGTRALGIGRAATLAGVSLLLCDACEGLDEAACRALSEVRAAAPHITLVLTSQRPLGLDAELPFSLGPMSDADARALFTSRVTHARGGGGLGLEEVGQVDALLERLANLPLAVELAASRLAVLDVGTLLERLGAGLDVIDHGSALSATIDWAISLLETNDRAGLAQATAFDGGFDLEAAEAVIDVGPGRVIDWLQAMVRRSLISVRRNARGARYELYEAVKHQAARLLDDDGRRAVHARFTSYFAHAAARWAEAPASRRRRWMHLLELAEDDLDAAETALERARVEGEGVLSPRDFVLIVDGLIEVADARGEVERARDLWAEAELLRARRTVVYVASDGSRFRTSGGASVCLARRRSARLVLAALVAQRGRAPSSSLSREQMVEAGWPGERILEKAARQRLYVLINTLRKLGLDALETTDEGYRLDPETAYEVR